MTIRSILTILILIVIVSFGWATNYYRNLAERSRQDYMNSKLLTIQLSGTINQLKEKQEMVANLDEKLTKELNDAKNKIDTLKYDVATGRKQLQLQAFCNKTVSAYKTSSTASLDDGDRARLADSAEQDYYTLRKRIELAQKQIEGLQIYILQQCNN